MARTQDWRKALVAALLAGAAFACTEDVAAPGRCPDLCSADSLPVIDTIITGVVIGDTSVRGYTDISQLPILVVANQPLLDARTLIRFAPVPKRWFPSTLQDTGGIRIGTVDSVTLDLRLDARDTTAKNLRILVYHFPGDSLDSTVTYAQALPLFSFGNFIDSVPVDDTLQVANLHRVLPITPFVPDTALADTLNNGVGLWLRSDSLTVAVIAATDFTNVPAHLKYYVHGAAPYTDSSTVFDLTPVFDSYVASPPPRPIQPHTLVIGNQPAARAFLRFQIPSYYVDSVSITRATLIMTPATPPRGFPHTSFGLQALPVLRFLGGKSLLVQDTSLLGRGTVTVASSADVSLEVGAILRLWKGTNSDSLPRAIAIQAVNETFETGEFVGQGSTGASPPRLQISFVRSLKFGVP